MDYALIKFLHVLSATVLFGTGAGTAFQMWRAHQSGNVATIANVARSVVIADYVFTSPAVIIQPLTGITLAILAGYDLLAPWLVGTYLLYVLTGACWLPVVWLQIQIRNLAQEASRQGHPLPNTYYRYMQLWFTLGWPAFASIVAIFWLMVAKPQL